MVSLACKISRGGWEMKIRYGFCVLMLLLASPIWSKAQSGLSQTVLNFVWQPIMQNVDLFSSTVGWEHNNYPSNLGSIFYIPCCSGGSNYAPLWRLYASWIPDHMDSTTPGEGGYNTEGAIGYPYTTSGAVPGLNQIVRIYNGRDHGTVKAGQSVSGYWLDGNLGLWGFPRYGWTLDALTWLSGGGVTISSNAVAGGAIWNWQWNGAEFIDNADNDYGADFGREMQSAFFNFISGGTQNPTEAGSRWAGFCTYNCSYSAVQDWQGSPLVTLFNNGLSQTSAAVPLEFLPENWGGGQDHPVAYTGVQLGKQITLDYQGLGSVAQYVTTLTLPSGYYNATFEIPTAYSPSTIGPNSEPFTEFYVYDLGNNSLKDVTGCVQAAGNSGFVYSLTNSSSNSCVPYPQSSGFAGVIISTRTGDYAMGDYGVATVLPTGSCPSGCGSVSSFGLWLTPFGTPTVKWHALYDGTDGITPQIQSGNSCYTTWAMTGTLSQVLNYMSQLHAGQVSNSIPYRVPSASCPNAH
jgi:hypothetical protein